MHPNTCTAPAALPHFRSRIVPVVVVSDPTQAVPMANALLAGGIDVIEITLRSEAALAAIEAVARQVPDMVVGAGTVTRADEVDRVRDAGARFALSPGFTQALLHQVKAAGLPFIPGVASPSEAMTAREHGFTLMKCFPAAQLGGVEVLKAWGGPLPDLRFCPTGGVTLANLGQFLALPNVAMAGGSWLTPAALVNAGDWAAITRLAAEATALLAA
jgi:2-dehydro-3-deoxyphosphogluconate aldolase / (4S)-4-hydroxy-2-oxoglutarate aldolase